MPIVLREFTENALFLLLIVVVVVVVDACIRVAEVSGRDIFAKGCQRKQL
jgi:hypothetical protein